MRTRLANGVMAVIFLALCAASLHADDAGWQPRSGHSMVAFQDALILTGGLYAFDKNFFFNDVWRSTDGVLWSPVDAAQTYSPQRQLHSSLVFQNHVWVLGGQSNVYLNDVWRSADGGQWEQVVEEAPWSARRGMACVVHNNAIYLLGGEDASHEYHSDVWVSEDGTTWELRLGSAPWKQRWGHAAVSFQNALFVLGGNAAFGKFNDVWRSADGVTWTKVGELPVAIRGHRAEVFNNKIYVFGGIDGDDALLNQVWSSSDGITWTVVAAAASWPGRARHASAVYQNRLWLAGGTTAEGDSNDVWQSRDGVNWQSASETSLCGCNCSGNDAKTWRDVWADGLLLGVSLLVLLSFRR